MHRMLKKHYKQNSYQTDMNFLFLEYILMSRDHMAITMLYNGDVFVYV